MACAPNYLVVASWLQGKLRNLTADETSTKWRELLETAAEEFGVEMDDFVHSRIRSKTLL